MRLLDFRLILNKNHPILFVAVIPVTDKQRQLLPLHFSCDPGADFTWWADSQDCRIADAAVLSQERRLEILSEVRIRFATPTRRTFCFFSLSTSTSIWSNCLAMPRHWTRCVENGRRRRTLAARRPTWRRRPGRPSCDSLRTSGHGNAATIFAGRRLWIMTSLCRVVVPHWGMCSWLEYYLFCKFSMVYLLLLILWIIYSWILGWFSETRSTRWIVKLIIHPSQCHPSKRFRRRRLDGLVVVARRSGSSKATATAMARLDRFSGRAPAPIWHRRPVALDPAGAKSQAPLACRLVPASFFAGKDRKWSIGGWKIWRWTDKGCF